MAVVAGAVLAAHTVPTIAQGSRPSTAERLVQAWDFEDELAELKVMPDHWFREFREPDDGELSPFPAFNQSEFSRSAAHSGELSLMLPTQGGSTRVRLASGVVAALPGARYHTTAMLMTQDVDRARARIGIRFLDREFGLIEDSASATRLTSTGGEWRRVSVETDAPQDAAWIQLSAELLQPDQFDYARRLPQETATPDVRGAAFIDDLRLYQVPQIRLATQSPGNMVVAPDQPEFQMRMRDLTGEGLTTELRVFDIAGQEVDRASDVVTSDGRLSTYEPALPGYGWYRASLRVGNSQGVVGQRSVDFVWTPKLPLRDRRRAQMFGLMLEPVPVDELTDLPGLIARSGAGAVSIPAWASRDPPPELAREDPEAAAELRREGDIELARTLETLLADEREVSFVLARLPRELARTARLDTTAVRELLARDPSEWYDELSQLLTRFGERVLRWQVGESLGAGYFSGPELNEEAERIADSFYKLVPRPIIAVPWNIHQSILPQWRSPRSIVVRVPESVHANALGEYVEQWPDESEIRFVIDELDAEYYGVRAGIVDLVLKAVAAWEAEVEEIAIDQPWLRQPGADGELVPKPAAGVWRVFSHMLAGRTPLGELRIGEGLRCAIAEGDGDAILIAWNERSRPEHAQLTGFLGGGPITVRDVFGNVEEIIPNEVDEVEIPLADMPVYIEGVDVELLKFRTMLMLDPPMLPARAERHPVELTVANPWRGALTGALRFVEPEGWEIYPGVVDFTIPPGETTTIPLSIILGLATEAGPLDIEVEARLSADRPYPPIKLPIHTKVGLEEIELSTSDRLVAGEDGELNDVVVTLLITNVSTEQIPIESFAIAPGYAAQQTAIVLAPNQSIAHQYVLEDAADRLSGSIIRAGVRERNGNGRLNHTIEIP